MTTHNQIRQTLLRHRCLQFARGAKAWLIKGDFDHFKLTNDIYGSLVSDYLLDWTLEVIEAEIRQHQKNWGCGEALCNFTGDDVTIYIPPSQLTEGDIARMLWRVRAAITQSFARRYVIGVVALPEHFFDDAAEDSLQKLRETLDGMDVVFDFARRARGYLALLPVGGRGAEKVYQDVLRVIERGCGKAIPGAAFRPDWIYNPDDPAARAFLGDYLAPPSVSFAACAVDLKAGWDRLENSSAFYELASHACQSVLKICKQQRKGVAVRRDAAEIVNALQPQHTADIALFDSPLRWSSERYLREKLYFRRLSHPVLFQFNPVYLPAPGVLPFAVDAQMFGSERYRGNAYGIGLKGVNEIFGHHTADCMIGQLTSIVSKLMQRALAAKGLPPDGVHIARFVDRFTVCCEQPFFDAGEVTALVRGLAELYHSIPGEIRISHQRVSIAAGGDHITGYQLFQRLALTGLSPCATLLEDADPPVEVRQSGPSDPLEGARDGLERISFEGAKQMVEWIGEKGIPPATHCAPVQADERLS